MKRTPNTNPWRSVLTDPAPIVYEGRGGVLGPDTDRRTRWWEMTLECGHQVERTVSYRTPTPGEYVNRRHRSYTDVLPHPRRVRCEQCAVDARREARAVSESRAQR